MTKPKQTTNFFTSHRFTPTNKVPRGIEDCTGKWYGPLQPCSWSSGNRR
jgi:hypothetical protein